MADQLTLGEALRDEGMVRVDAAEPDTWKHSADLAIELLVGTGQEFTSEDVRRFAGDPTRPNAMGARLASAARRGIIRHAGWTKATRPGMHATDLKTWVGA